MATKEPTQFAQLHLGTPAEPRIELTTQVDKDAKKAFGMSADANEKAISIISPKGKIELTTELGKEGDKPIKVIIDAEASEVSIVIDEDIFMVINKEQWQVKLGNNEAFMSKDKHEWTGDGGSMTLTTKGNFTVAAEGDVSISGKGSVSIEGSQVGIGKEVKLGG